MNKPKTMIYLCDCGAKNAITAEPREHKAGSLLFFCASCGRPNHDRFSCTHRSPVGEDHAFCQICGANSEGIQRGVESVNLSQLRRDLVYAMAVCAGFQYVMQTWVQPYLHQRAVHQAERHETDPLALPVLGGMLAVCIGPALVIPLYTFLTGAPQAPFGVRTLAHLWRIGNLDSLEEHLTEQAHRSRKGLRRMARRLSRYGKVAVKRFRKRIAEAKVDTHTNRTP